MKYPFGHEWHVAVNRHQDEQRKAGRPLSEARFMYEALHVADEVPRMAKLFKAERERCASFCEETASEIDEGRSIAADIRAGKHWV